MRTVVGRALVTGVALLALAGCGGLSDAGSAASVGDVTMSTDLLAEQVGAVQEQRGLPRGGADSALTLSVLQRLIITELVGQAATAQGVTVTPGEIDTATAGLEAQLGGPEALQTAFLDSDVPAESIPRQVTLSLQVQKLGAALAPQADPSAQQQAVVQYVTGFGLQQGVQVSPRFGTWEAGTLTIGPVPSDLSSSQTGEDPLAGLVPAP